VSYEPAKVTRITEKQKQIQKKNIFFILYPIKICIFAENKI